ncbi:MAG: DUF3379 family protein [Woeseiaceae bacterium]
MNCEQYRQAVAADPSFDGAAEHVSVCAECRAFRDEMRALDAGIAKALQLELPALTLPELPSIGAQDKVVSIASRRSPPKARWFALAASVMLAAVIGIRMFAVDVDNISLADEVLAHLDHDPAALVASATPVSDERLIKVVPESVAHMDHSAGLITYAQSCVINGKTVPHLVIQGERGPITILLMPEEKIAAAQTLDGDNVHGVLLPVGNGSIAIIGARDEPLERIEKSVLSSVAWST